MAPVAAIFLDVLRGRTRGELPVQACFHLARFDTLSLH